MNRKSQLPHSCPLLPHSLYRNFWLRPTPTYMSEWGMYPMVGTWPPRPHFLDWGRADLQQSGADVTQLLQLYIYCIYIVYCIHVYVEL
jgi:hypothetical protein